MSAPLDRLFSALPLGGIVLANRIVSTAHNTGLNDGPRIGERLTAYYSSRASAGVGLIIMGSTSVHQSSGSRLTPAVANWDDTIIPQYRALADAIHRTPTRLFAQLNHAGAQSGVADGTGRIVAPSAIDGELGVETPHALEVEEIAVLIEAFAAAAQRVREGGLDGLELHGGHGNLIQQFLSPLTNRREDAYGGTPQKRQLFAEQVLQAVRARVGADFVVGLRISAEEDHPGGLTLAETQRIVPELVAAGALDYVNVTSGSDMTAWSLAHHYAPMYLPRQHLRHLARGIKDVAGVPVIAVGRVVDPRDAEAILQAGDADLVGMTRALIADRDLPAKARRGALDDIRICVGVNDGCLGRLMRGLPITCIQDPTSGREHSLGLPAPTARPRRVVVVGGGVAGLEAARLAAWRGHEVTLLEREAQLGGQLLLAHRAPGRGELEGIIDDLRRRVAQTTARVRTGVTVTAEMLLALAPDAVVLATGSEPRLPELAMPEERLFSARAVLAGIAVHGPVVLLDTKGDMVGPSTADFLAGRGHPVTLVTPRRVAGALIEPMTWRLLQQRLLDQGVAIMTETELVGLGPEGMVVRHRIAGRETTLPGIASLVAACGARAEDSLHRQLREKAPQLETLLVGDAAAPRDIERAIYEGHMAARQL